MKQVSVGSKVILGFSDGEEVFYVRNPNRNSIGLGDISTESPLGKLIIGRKIGETISTTNGNMVLSCKIVKIE